jgi:processive 1,2-diacylglycerol beta-glucosyltransferase
LPQPFHILAITGQNEKLQESLTRKGAKLRHPTKIFGFVDRIHEFMEIAEVIVTKPGGITTAEALVKRLPMIIINPIPGQEAKNSDFLLRHGVAVQAEDANDVMLYVDDFFRNPEKLRKMRAAAVHLGRPRAAAQAAEAILQLRAPAPALVA